MSEKTFKVKALRTVKSPSDDSISTYFAWVNFKDLPAGLSLDVNPRKPKMTTSVAKQLISAVKDTESDFDINNRGIVLTAKNVNFNTKDGMLNVDFGDDKYHYGVLDGGHTYKAIIDNRDDVPKDLNKYVRLEIIVGDNVNVSSLADARNTSVQVSDIALFELSDRFGFLKEDIKDEPYANDIAYKDNDNKDIPVAKLLRLMFAFNIKKYPNDDQAPIQSYSSKAMVFKDYRKEYGDGEDTNPNNIYVQLAKQLPTLVKLYETIQAEIGDKYKEYKERDGKRASFGSVRGVERNGLTDFTQQTIPYEVSNGFIMPIFGAFRALLEENEEHNGVDWAADPIEVWEKAGSNLVQNTFEAGTIANTVGKTRTVWQSNYRIVDGVRKDILLEKLLNLKNN